MGSHAAQLSRCRSCSVRMSLWLWEKDHVSFQVFLHTRESISRAGASWVWVSVSVDQSLDSLWFSCIYRSQCALSLSCFYGVLLCRSVACACMAVVLLDLRDRLLRLTDSSALQAAIHQPVDLLQPWEHRHICVGVCVFVYVCVWESVSSGGQRGAETGPVAER